MKSNIRTQKTLKYFRDQGFIGDSIERWIPIPIHPGGGKRKDFLGFGDMLFFNDRVVILVQSCGQSFAEHAKKILDNEFASLWLAGKRRRLVLVGWRKLLKKRGGKQKVWKPRIADFYLFDGKIDFIEKKIGKP